MALIRCLHAASICTWIVQFRPRESYKPHARVCVEMVHFTDVLLQEHFGIITKTISRKISLWTRTLQYKTMELNVNAPRTPRKSEERKSEWKNANVLNTGSISIMCWIKIADCSWSLVSHQKALLLILDHL